MKITIKEPVTNTDMDLDAEPEDYNGDPGWRIIFPEKDSFVMVKTNGDWTVVDEEDINPKIVEAIGNALHQQDRYNMLT
jgi:hypothetical protein